MKKQGKLTTERETEESASSKICPVRCTSREDDSSGEIESWLFVERVSKQLLLWRHPVYLPQKFFTAYFNDTVQHNSHTILRGTREKKLLIKKTITSVSNFGKDKLGARACYQRASKASAS